MKRISYHNNDNNQVNFGVSRVTECTWYESRVSYRYVVVFVFPAIKFSMILSLQYLPYLSFMIISTFQLTP
jgi:hypothetical protein